MHLEFIFGDNDVSKQIAESKPCTFIELWNTYIGSNSISGITWDNREKGIFDLVICYDCWEATNTFHNIHLVIQQIVTYLNTHIDKKGTVTVVIPNEKMVFEFKDKYCYN